MIEKILNRFDFANPQLTKEVLFFAAVVWALVVLCTIWSICTKYKSFRARAIWSLVVVCLPVVGLLVYLPYSLTEDPLLPFRRFGRQFNS
jgi:hypothetical protein